MHKRTIFLIAIALVVLVILGWLLLARPGVGDSGPLPACGEAIELPDPAFDSDMSVEKALLERRSLRAYSGQPLTLAETSQLLWAAQGITHPNGYRTAPSAGALYPLEVYLLAGDVQGLPIGIYKYRPQGHELVMVLEGDVRQALYEAGLQQQAIRDGAAVIVFAAVYERTAQKYGQRAERYVHMEVGAACQNVYLQAGTLGLGTVFIGAFYDEEVKTTLSMPGEEEPLGIMPIGRP